MKNKYLYLAVVLLSMFIACKETVTTEIVENRDAADVLLERYTRDKTDFAKDGKYEAFYEDGTTKEIAFYQNDTLQGERKLFRPDGSLEIVENYENGIFSGPYKQYYKNGQVSFEGVYIQNEMDGIWKGYYEDGQPKEEVAMRESDENGPFVEYHPNGSKSVEGVYKNGPFEEGQLIEYDEAGNILSKKFCHLGICKEIWTPEEGDINIDYKEFTAFAKRMKAMKDQVGE